MRFILGILLIYQSNVSKFPFVIEILGWLAIVAAIFFALMGRKNFICLITWALSLVKPYGRIGGIIAAVFWYISCLCFHLVGAKFMTTRLIATLWLCLVTTSALAVGEGDQAPAWNGIDLVDGSQIEFPDILDDKPAVLVFWATWCPYCKAFMPYVKEIQTGYAKHGIQIISFNALERGIGNPKAYVDTLGFPLVAIAEADNIAEQCNVQFIPGLMVVNETV